MAEGLILVKLGGSVITDAGKPRTPRLREIRRLIKEIKRSGSKNIVIGHGGGSFPHVPAHRYKVQCGLINKSSRFGASLTQRAAADLHGIVINEMLKLKMPAFSFSASSGAVADGKRITGWDLDVLRKAIKNGFIPVTYGDLAIDSKQGVCIVSTEEIFRYLALKLRPKMVIIGSDVDGVFTDDPKMTRAARFITNINKDNIKGIALSPENKRKFNVTGSMKSKVELLYKISESCSATCQIVNANVPGRLYNAILGKPVKSTTVKA